MKKTKTQKGITLIALIITIVVLLILAAVTISAIQGDGIIAKAGQARDKYNQAQTDEEAAISELESYLSNNAGPWIQDKTVVKNIQTGQTLAVGDTVNYDAGVSTYTGGWKVLGAENGEVVLLSTKIIYGFYSADNAERYAGFVDELDEMCEPYKAGSYATRARALNAEDVDKITGYNKTKYGEGTANQYGNTVIGTLGEDEDTLSWVVQGNESITGSLSLSERGTGEIYDLDGTKLGALDSYKVGPLTGYSYNLVSILGENSLAFKMLCPNYGSDEESNNYCLATPSLSFYAGNYGVGFQTIYDEAGTMEDGSFYNGGGGYWGCFGGHVRAVVSLDSSIVFTSAGANAWNLPTT